MTNQTNWYKYTGTDEQIADMHNSKEGFLLNCDKCKDILNGRDFVNANHLTTYLSYCQPTHYWIIPDDPLREMKVRQAMTGQPVWIKMYSQHASIKGRTFSVCVTTTPDWNIPNAEYSFTPFEE